MDIKELISWDRETALTFASMLVASYAWVASEHLLAALAVGIAMHAILVVGYEALAFRFEWKHLDIAQFILNRFRTHQKALRVSSRKTFEGIRRKNTQRA